MWEARGWSRDLGLDFDTLLVCRVSAPQLLGFQISLRFLDEGVVALGSVGSLAGASSYRGSDAGGRHLQACDGTYAGPLRGGGMEMIEVLGIVGVDEVCWAWWMLKGLHPARLELDAGEIRKGTSRPRLKMVVDHCVKLEEYYGSE